jgi:hypothetical protein
MGPTEDEDEVAPTCDGMRDESERSVRDPLYKSTYIYKIVAGEVVGF